uniref:RING-type domain-containing protein n=1 Tax=Meloidogyne javanica TaxID=6303 RepID=A0A915MSW9_MELJA
MSGACFCKRVLNLPLALMECCYTVAHKECLLKSIKSCKRCPCKDCLKPAKKENVLPLTLTPPEIKSQKKIFSKVSDLGKVLVNRFKDVSPEDSENIGLLNNAFNDFLTGKPSNNDGDSWNGDVDTFRETKFQWIMRFLKSNKVSIIVLAVALASYLGNESMANII